jgi:hypothetical protein
MLHLRYLNISTSFIEKVDKEILKFVWNNKPPKIKTTTIISDIEYGGLKMPNFETIVSTQKIMWVKRVLDNTEGKWKALAIELMGLTEQQLKSKLSLEYINHKQTPFYYQVLHEWYKFYSREPLNRDIKYEFLWNNKFILIDKRPIQHQYKEWAQNGIYRITDLINEQGELLSTQELGLKYNFKVDIMKFNSLKQAIPSKWKRALRSESHSSEKIDTSTMHINGKNFDINNLKSSDVYWLIIKQKQKSPTAIQKWIADYPFLNDNDFKCFFTLPYKILRSTKVQTFQYKLLHRTIPCKNNLYKWKLVETPNCNSCTEIETIEHFFYNCERTKGFWNSLLIWIKNNLELTIALSVVDVLFGIPFEQDDLLLYLNFIILQAKWFIYKTKLISHDLFILQFIQELNYCTKLEYLAELTKKSENENKWKTLNDLLNVTCN